jgi:hypothetical protein
MLRRRKAPSRSTHGNTLSTSNRARRACFETRASGPLLSMTPLGMRGSRPGLGVLPPRHAEKERSAVSRHARETLTARQPNRGACFETRAFGPLLSMTPLEGAGGRIALGPGTPCTAPSQANATPSVMLRRRGAPSRSTHRKHRRPSNRARGACFETRASGPLLSMTRGVAGRRAVRASRASPAP